MREQATEELVKEQEEMSELSWDALINPALITSLKCGVTDQTPQPVEHFVHLT